MNSTDHAALLAPSYFIDSDHPAVVEFAMRAIDGAQESRERAVRLYYAVRDQIRYNPYAADMSREAMKASTVADTPAEA